MNIIDAHERFVSESEHLKRYLSFYNYLASYVKYSSFARPILLSLQKFHNCDNLTEENIIKIGRELNERNILGHFYEIFNAAKIECILNQSTTGEKVFDDWRFCYPHVNLNLCWSHCVSEQMTKNMINEWLDLIPVNKIIGFGGM